ncbi:MAG TPA: class I SAM-dependent methyltransferase [Drouetiella sp.]|jgi:methyl halide transferase
MSESQKSSPVITDWDDRYKQGPEALPWDSGEPSGELVAYIESLKKAPAKALEIGCGTGTNAIWLARRGCEVVATDLSETAINMAKKKLADSGLTNVEFKVDDVIARAPVPAGSIDFVYDRGVYHVMDPGNRDTFINRVSDCLKDGGAWLCLAGSADERVYGRDQGPPQLKASELIDLAEKKFEVQYLRTGAFLMPDGTPRKMWEVLYKKR